MANPPMIEEYKFLCIWMGVKKNVFCLSLFVCLYYLLNVAFAFLFIILLSFTKPILWQSSCLPCFFSPFFFCTVGLSKEINIAIKLVAQWPIDANTIWFLSLCLIAKTQAKTSQFYMPILKWKQPSQFHMLILSEILDLL